MRVLIAAGGTGGHIYPGIAVAQEIMRRDPTSVVSFVGTARGLETRLVPNAGFELKLIESSGLKKVGTLALLRGLLILPKSFFAARRLIRDFRPDIVVGAGGYVSGPVLLAASLMKLPTLVMDSNALPGWTNRVLARFVDRAAVSFAEALPHFRGKGVLTGNPVRSEFFEIPARQHGNQISLLVFGGSQGARAINEAMVEALPHLASQKNRLRVTHQTGTVDREKVEQGYAAAGWSENVEVKPYIDDIVNEFGRADLIVSRAGATTSAELVAAGKAAIMIPFPLAADDHQRKNAEALQSAGAARVILQSELTGERLATEISGLLASPEQIVEMENASRKLARRDAAAATVNLMEEVIDGRRR